MNQPEELQAIKAFILNVQEQYSDKAELQSSQDLAIQSLLDLSNVLVEKLEETLDQIELLKLQHSSELNYTLQMRDQFKGLYEDEVRKAQDLLNEMRSLEDSLEQKEEIVEFSMKTSQKMDETQKQLKNQKKQNEELTSRLQQFKLRNENLQQMLSKSHEFHQQIQLENVKLQKELHDQQIQISKLTKQLQKKNQAQSYSSQYYERLKLYNEQFQSRVHSRVQLPKLDNDCEMPSSAQIPSQARMMIEEEIKKLSNNVKAFKSTNKILTQKLQQMQNISEQQSPNKKIDEDENEQVTQGEQQTYFAEDNLEIDMKQSSSNSIVFKAVPSEYGSKFQSKFQSRCVSKRVTHVNDSKFIMVDDVYLEFFKLLVQCAKLNHRHPSRVITMNLDSLYKDFIKQKIPFNFWYKKIEQTIQ
ncbi:hypothetical protein pb186bvf_008208 [Paramecium bursaria]